VAASHFKSKESISALSAIKSFGQFNRVVWTFGCSVHGKGQSDGYGGTIKNTITLLLTSHSNPVFIDTPKQYFDVVFELFGSEAATLKYEKSKTHVIKQWSVIYIDKDDTEPFRSRVREVDKLKDLHHVGLLLVMPYELFSNPVQNDGPLPYLTTTTIQLAFRMFRLSQTN